jgi:hypothetical protein
VHYNHHVHQDRDPDLYLTDPDTDRNPTAEQPGTVPASNQVLVTVTDPAVAATTTTEAVPVSVDDPIP